MSAFQIVSESELQSVDGGAYAPVVLMAAGGAIGMVAAAAWILGGGMK